MKQTNMCEGSCEEHRGSVQSVHVTQDGYDWGLFMYCEKAIEEDTRRGMNVEIVNVSVHLTDNSAAAGDEVKST